MVFTIKSQAGSVRSLHKGALFPDRVPEVLEWRFSVTATSAVLTDFIEVRKVAKPAGARMAAERATANELATIEKV